MENVVNNAKVRNEMGEDGAPGAEQEQSQALVEVYYNSLAELTS